MTRLMRASQVKNSVRHPDYVLLLAAMVLTITGFWDLYLEPGSDPNRFHHAHVLTTSVWLSLLLYQRNLVRDKRYHEHRKVGLAVLGLAPLLVSTVALLSVHSAQKGLASGEGDFLIVQNVGVTLELAFLIVLAFILRKRRKLHGALLLSTAMLFMGIALFFTLISFVPPFRIEGPETFYRFATAGAASRYLCLAIGCFFFVRDWKNGWPLLLAGSFFSLNEMIRGLLETRSLLAPLTEFVGSLSQPFTFVASFASMLAVLAATGLLSNGQSGNSTRPTPLGGAA
jgi:hypothetical protein